MPYPKQAVNVYVENLDDEVCVYDWEQKQMHALNPTAALVWEQCDGQTDPAQMAARLESELNVPNADKLVSLSLDRLQKARLLEGATPSQTQRTITRREVLKMVGIGLALLPVVSSIALPSAAQAQSCTPNCNYDIAKPDGVDCVTACEDYISIFNYTLCSAQETMSPQGSARCMCYTYSGGPGCIQFN